MIRSCCTFVILMQCIGLFVLLSMTDSHETLRLVHVIFRHGERSPSKTYTNDPYKDQHWPGGWDQLSTNGKMEEFHLGEALRQRYNVFLPDVYHQNDVLVQSSYADRCLMSAQLLLAGLYPPVGSQLWNEKLLWQPIPVHSIPRHIDNKIAIKMKCPRYQAALKEIYQMEKVLKINEENKELFDYLTLNTGDDIQNISTVETLFNTLEIEKLNNLTLPNWTGSVFPGNMLNLAAVNLAIYTETQLMKRLHGGVLVKEILEQMKQKKGNIENRLMYLYSGHDLTVVTLLRVLGFGELIKPEFGATVIVELHEINSRHVVKFYSVKNPYKQPEELTLESCGIPCELDKLSDLLSSVIPNNWDYECLQL